MRNGRSVGDEGWLVGGSALADGLAACLRSHHAAAVANALVAIAQMVDSENSATALRAVGRQSNIPSNVPSNLPSIEVGHGPLSCGQAHVRTCLSI